MKVAESLTTCVSAQSCLTLCNPMDCSLPGFSVHRILQARILEWVAMPSSRGSSRPRDWIYFSYIACIGRRVLYHKAHLGSPASLWSSSKTHQTKQSAYHYNCAHRPQEAPDEPCFCIQPAAMKKNRSQSLYPSPNPQMTHALPGMLMEEYWRMRLKWKFSFRPSSLVNIPEMFS